MPGKRNPEGKRKYLLVPEKRNHRRKKQAFRSQEGCDSNFRKERGGGFLVLKSRKRVEKKKGSGGKKTHLPEGRSPIPKGKTQPTEIIQLKMGGVSPTRH